MSSARTDRSLRLIVAYVQPFMAPKVVHALHQVPGLTGATFIEARGFGRGRRTDAPNEEVIAGTAERVRVEVVIALSMEDAVVKTIREAAHTGNRGDGKIFVLPVDRGVRISTGEDGDVF